MDKKERAIIGSIQDDLGESLAHIRNDRDNESFEKAIKLINESFNRCIQLLSKYPPIS